MAPSIHRSLIFCDNENAIKLATIEAYRERSKHIDIRYHHLREYVQPGKITIRHIGTEHMTADSLTKALGGEKTNACAAKMGLMN